MNYQGEGRNLRGNDVTHPIRVWPTIIGVVVREGVVGAACVIAIITGPAAGGGAERSVATMNSAPRQAVGRSRPPDDVYLRARPMIKHTPLSERGPPFSATTRAAPQRVLRAAVLRAGAAVGARRGYRDPAGRARRG